MAIDGKIKYITGMVQNVAGDEKGITRRGGEPKTGEELMNYMYPSQGCDGYSFEEQECR